MQKLYKILWFIAILLIIVTTIIFSFGLILILVTAMTVFGIYRYFFIKKKSREFKKRPHSQVEVIDLQYEVIHETIQAKKPDEF